MQILQLNTPLHEILKLTYEYIAQYGHSPYRNNNWFEERTPYQGNYISNIKTELKKLKFLNDDLTLTEKGEKYAALFFNPFTVRAAEVRIQGSVRASPSDDWYVNLDELDNPSESTIVIPNITLGRETFALKVSGPSMREIGIFDGDYAIVQRQDNLWWPNPKEVIIATYVPHDPKRSTDFSPSPDDYVGPVIKVYNRRFGEKGCELGWKRGNERNPYVILVDELIPVGKVIGIYRDLTQFSIFEG